MCGIPWHAADNYFGRLVKSGFKVALVEQMETPAQAKERGHKFIERQVIRVLTPGTLTDENLLSPKKSNFLVSVVPVENAKFDIAGCDISTGEIFIGSTDSIIDDMIRINPAEIIYPEQNAENQLIMFHYFFPPLLSRVSLYFPLLRSDGKTFMKPRISSSITS